MHNEWIISMCPWSIRPSAEDIFIPYFDSKMIRIILSEWGLQQLFMYAIELGALSNFTYCLYEINERIYDLWFTPYYKQWERRLEGRDYLHWIERFYTNYKWEAIGTYAIAIDEYNKGRRARKNHPVFTDVYNILTNLSEKRKERWLEKAKIRD